jgi:hypothetical protein
MMFLEDGTLLKLHSVDGSNLYYVHLMILKKIGALIGSFYISMHFKIYIAHQSGFLKFVLKFITV